ncbi:MAG: hypothetical protein AB1589_26215 [Cyanobacteriota bacterium]
MLLVKKLPWTSLLLLLCTYGVFGWLLNDLYSSWLIWLIGAAYILLIALALTDPQRLIRSFYVSSLKSDSRAFVSVIVGAFVAVVFMNWIGIFVRILVLISACALVRLDLQTAGYSKWQSFWILVVVSLSGFGLGILAKQWDWPIEVGSLLRN